MWKIRSARHKTRASQVTASRISHPIIPLEQNSSGVNVTLVNIMQLHKASSIRVGRGGNWLIRPQVKILQQCKHATNLWCKRLCKDETAYPLLFICAGEPCVSLVQQCLTMKRSTPIQYIMEFARNNHIVLLNSSELSNALKGISRPWYNRQ